MVMHIRLLHRAPMVGAAVVHHTAHAHSDVEIINK